MSRGLGTVQRHALLALAASPEGLTLAEVQAAAVGVRRVRRRVGRRMFDVEVPLGSTGTMMRALRGLAARGLVEIQVTPTGRRPRVFSASADGKDLAAALRASVTCNVEEDGSRCVRRSGDRREVGAALLRECSMRSKPTRSCASGPAPCWPSSRQRAWPAPNSSTATERDWGQPSGTTQRGRSTPSWWRRRLLARAADLRRWIEARQVDREGRHQEADSRSTSGASG